MWLSASFLSTISRLRSDFNDCCLLYFCYFASTCDNLYRFSFFFSLIIAILIPVFEWLYDIIIEPISDKIRDKIYGHN